MGAMDAKDQPKPWGTAPAYSRNVRVIILPPNRAGTEIVGAMTMLEPDAQEVQRLASMIREQAAGSLPNSRRQGAARDKALTAGLAFAVLGLAVKTGPLPAGIALLLGLLLERLLAKMWPAEKVNSRSR